MNPEDLEGFDDLTPEEQDELRQRLEEPEEIPAQGNLSVDPRVATLIGNAGGILEKVRGASSGDFGNIASSGIESFFDSILGIPQGIGELLAIGGAGLQTVAETPFVNGGFVDRFQQNRETQRGQFPASALLSIPRVDSRDIKAGIKTIDSFSPLETGLTGDFGERFKQAQLLENFQKRANQAVNPISTAIGEGLGDVATLAVGRGALGRPKAAAAGKLATTKPLPLSVKSKFDGIVGRISKSVQSTTPKLARGAARVGEVGLEAAALELLNEGDPIKMFAFGAGAQSIGSLGLFLLEKPLLKGAAAVAATAFVGHELLKAVLPGDQDFFESKDFAIQTVVAAYVIGSMAALTGSGRLSGKAIERAPLFFDTLTQGSRTLTRSFLVDMFASKNSGGIEFKVLGKMAEGRGFFNANQINSLGRAMTSDKEGAFAKEVERLMKESPSFRELMDKL